MKGKNVLIVLVSLLLILSIEGAIAGNRVLFYEGKVSGNYKISADYSQFKEELKNKGGYEVDELQGLSRDFLDTRKPDVIVLPNLGGDLTADEMTAVFEFVMDGGGLFLCGASSTSSVNKLTTPLGMSVDKYILEDENNRVRKMSDGALIEDKNTFHIRVPQDSTDPTIKAFTKDVNKLHVFGGNGIHIFGNAIALVRGSEYTHSPKSVRFPKGTMPPVASYVRVGSGSVVLLSDPDMLSNKYFEYGHNNVKFAINIVDWLSTPFEGELDEDEFEIVLKIKETEIIELNRTIRDMQGDIEERDGHITQLTSEKDGLQAEIADLKKDRFMWFTYTTWAMILIAIAIFLAVAVVAQKSKIGRDEKEKGELKYELEDKALEEDSEFGTGIKEEDVENRLKEFENESE